VLKTILDELDCLARIVHKAHAYLKLYKGNYKPKNTTKTAFLKVSIRVLVCPLLFVSHFCITLMLELD